MTAPLPRGYVRLTARTGSPLLLPADRCVVSIQGTCVVVGVCGEPPLSACDKPASWQVRGTLDEVQAALVAALGAQGLTNQGGGGDAVGATKEGSGGNPATAQAPGLPCKPDPRSAAADSFEERVKALYGKYTNLGQEHPSHGGLDLMIRRALKAEDERDEARAGRWNWSDETGASFIDLRNALEKAGTTPYATTTGGLNRVAVAIECVHKLAAERDALNADIARLTKERDEACAESNRSAKRADRWRIRYRDAVAVAALARLAESGR